MWPATARRASAKTKTGPIAIVGAGIGGLALALALKRTGANPSVFERRSVEQVAGEGIFLTLAPNGLNALRGLGLADAALARGIETTGILLHNERGRALGLVDYEAHRSAFGAPSVTIRRGSLITTLLDAALSEGIEVRFGVSVDGIEATGDGVTLAMSGKSERFELVVGADGLRSTVRRMALPHLPSPVFNGLIGSGGIADVPSVRPTNGRMMMTFGRKAFFGYIKAADGPVYWFDSFVSASEVLSMATPEALAAHLQSLHDRDPLDNAAIIAAQRRVFGLYPDYDIPSLADWHTDRVVLIGDAAHAVTPHSGQGASMALEDALVLAACLDAEASPLSAFRRFESLRRQRVEAVVALGRQGGQQKKAQSWLSLRLRDLILPLVLPLGQRAQEKIFRFRADQTPLSQPT